MYLAGLQMKTVHVSYQQKVYVTPSCVHHTSTTENSLVLYASSDIRELCN